MTAYYFIPRNSFLPTICPSGFMPHIVLSLRVSLSPPSSHDPVKYPIELTYFSPKGQVSCEEYSTLISANVHNYLFAVLRIFIYFFIFASAFPLSTQFLYCSFREFMFHFYSWLTSFFIEILGEPKSVDKCFKQIATLLTQGPMRSS